MVRDVAMTTDFGMQFAITGFVGHKCCCMIASDTLFDWGVLICLVICLGWVFGINLSNEDIAEIQCLMAVAMATNFGTKIAINWICVNDSD